MSQFRFGLRTSRRGQTMVELALVMPLLTIVLTGIIVLGLGVFYQQQVTNAAREAARFAAIHSATAQCPTVSWLDPVVLPSTYFRCDAPEELSPGGNPDPWSEMSGSARARIFGLPASQVQIVACWSGYQDDATFSKDAPPDGAVAGIATTWMPCEIDGHDPSTTPQAIRCLTDLYQRTTDTASDLSEGQGRTVANQVTAFACYEWSPPLAGFLLIPEKVTLRGVITEPIQRQQ